MKNLGVNIDHVATVRNARGEQHPYPFIIAQKAIKFGANSIFGFHFRPNSPKFPLKLYN